MCHSVYGKWEDYVSKLRVIKLSIRATGESLLAVNQKPVEENYLAPGSCAKSSMFSYSLESSQLLVLRK